MYEELALMPEADARRVLAGRVRRFRVLAPVGAYAGRGALRVLRVRPAGDAADAGVELVCGYESYEGMHR